jgi:hypothetical protein
MLENNYIPRLEWEAINFPILINSIKFEQIEYGFSDDTTITVWRNENYQLKGKLSGYIKDPTKFERDTFIGKGNIIKGDTITGRDSLGNCVELSDCFLTGFHTNSWQMREGEYYADIELQLSTVQLNFLNDNSTGESLQLEWFICSEIDANFNETTFRKLNLSNPKNRIGLDEYDDSVNNLIGSSSSRDYILIDLPEVKCIVAKVPLIFPPKGLKGICLEFRSKEYSTPQIISCLKHFTSFLLGNKLIHIGSSSLSNNNLTAATLYSTGKNFLLDSNKNSMPPIKFNHQYDWGNFSWLANNLLPTFFILQNTLSLNQVLSRYWIARSVPVGANLPVLANAIEILASKYLKENGKFKMENIPDKEYINLIQAELTNLENKLSRIEGGTAMINKIKGANKKVPSEKMAFFFSLIGLEVGKSEKAAINLRNKMAHSARDYTDDDKAYDDLILTRVYEVLFNRVVLRLLGYDGYYIDYSITKCPSKHINIPAGNS